MRRKIEVLVWPKLRKKVEFKQTLDCLSMTFQDYCLSLRIDSQNENYFILSAEWSNLKQMRQMLQSKEFSILSGAIASLCESSDIRLDGKPFKHELSKLSTL